MRIRSLQASNLGSYESLKLDLTDKGLTLITGPTGAGKSTIMDSVSWALFGKTAKNGTADEIVKWDAEGPTIASIIVEKPDNSTFAIIRTRNPNDLYIDLGEGEVRGKDLKDTQIKINELLGTTPETFLAAVYMHEFSATSEFFQTNAKNRRHMMEQLADLSLAKKLQANASEHLKFAKQELKSVEDDLKIQRSLLQEKKDVLARQHQRWVTWQTNQADKIRQLTGQALDFEVERSAALEKLQYQHNDFETDRSDQIEQLRSDISVKETMYASLEEATAKARKELEIRKASLAEVKACSECGAAGNSHQLLIWERDLHKLEQNANRLSTFDRDISDLSIKIERKRREVNPYAAAGKAKMEEVNNLPALLEDIKTQPNPFDTSSLQQEFEVCGLLCRELVVIQKQGIKDISELETIQDVVQAFRATLISDMVTYLQTTTNQFLEVHFESELRATFTVADSDNLEIEIQKDGNVCSYTQLSKGQRQMLKLCFGASVQLAIANHSGVQFNTIFMDEVLTGLDEANKTKAFGLIQELATKYENVYIIEHSEVFKTLFTSQLRVELQNGSSVIYE
jgi:DNA repair exonuclease SbcCD ATPase subunit